MHRMSRVNVKNNRCFSFNFFSFCGITNADAMKQLVVQATVEVSGLIKILQNRKTLKKKTNSSCSHMQAGKNLIPI